MVLLEREMPFIAYSFRPGIELIWVQSSRGSIFCHIR